MPTPLTITAMFESDSTRSHSPPSARLLAARRELAEVQR